MRVLLVIYGSIDQLSGGYLYDRQVVASLRRRGVQVETLSLPQCPYLLCPFLPAGARRGLRRILTAEEREGRYDAVVIDELVHPSVFRAARHRRDTGPPLVTLVHHLRCREPGGAAVRGLACRMERILLRNSTAVVVNSRVTAETVRGLVEPGTPMYVCPPGSDLLPGLESSGTRFRQDARSPSRSQPGRVPSPRTRPTSAGDSSQGGAGPVRLLVTGNLVPRKGHDLLLQVLAGLREYRWHLRIVGRVVDRRYRRRLGRMQLRFGLAGRIDFTGALGGQQLAREYREADVFVFPSRYEGYGISLAEAVRAGLPFVAFSAGATAEVTEGRGLLFPPGDLEGFSAALAGLLADPLERERAGLLSREIAAGLPAWEDTGRRVFQALREVTAGG